MPVFFHSHPQKWVDQSEGVWLLAPACAGDRTVVCGTSITSGSVLGQRRENQDQDQHARHRMNRVRSMREDRLASSLHSCSGHLRLST